MLWAESFRVDGASTMHRHDLDELVIGLEGAGRQWSGRQQTGLTAGDLIFLPHGVSHQIITDGPLQVGVICFDDQPFGLRLRGLLAGLRAYGQVAMPRSAWSTGFVLQRWEALIAEVRRGLAFAAERVAATVSELLIELHRAVIDAADVSYDDQAAAIQAVAEVMAASPDAAWTVDGAAHQAGMSRATFTRHFRRVIGTSMVDFLRQIRLDRAANLLTHRPGMGVAQVALDAGFDNLAYFHRVFRQRFGLSPAAFRRRVGAEGVFPQLLQEDVPSATPEWKGRV